MIKHKNDHLKQKIIENETFFKGFELWGSMIEDIGVMIMQCGDIFIFSLDISENASPKISLNK